ncbi:DNA replication/repair protein RecF [Dendrosporobacter sp. 1207_IL3150]|uniref:DNA replication/repair protein RecF n=1 Tax=Dendrosporobacter sp. 1207_IL3150 TaxID=3084054 RepID=UPI002FDAB4BE
MRVKQLVLRNYRNYVNLSLNFTQNINIFLGQNAQGKTNVLEAIYYGAMGRSHRTNIDAELIRWNENAGSVNIVFNRLDVENNLNFRFINDQNKEIIYNGQAIKPRELIGALNVVLFSPEDLLLIKGAPVGRRRFLDTEISQANPAYYRQLMQYNRIISQRNTLLKKIREKKAKPDLLDSWDEQLAVLAANLVNKRLNAVKKLAMLANLMHRRITNSKENLLVNYQTSCIELNDQKNIAECYIEQLNSMRNVDIIRGSTGVGPHRDDLVLTVNGVNLRSFGSQGQQRTGVLALKLAELEFIKSETGEYPVLLLDDVMSELDANRREQLLAFIKDRVQTFITATDDKFFPEWKPGKYYTVTAGTITE